MRYWMTETVDGDRGGAPATVEPDSQDEARWELVGPASVCSFVRDGETLFLYVWTWREVPA